VGNNREEKLIKMSTERKEFDQNWDIFVVTGMSWSEIKGLSESDKGFILEKAEEAKARMLEQEKAKQDHFANIAKLQEEGRLPENGQGQ
jgi:hypothetical protein